MKIIRYHNSPIFSPAVSYPTLREEMDHLFDVAFPALNLNRFVGEFPVDLYQDEQAFHVRAEVPGFRKEEVGVEVADDVLTITAHQKAAKFEEKAGQEPARERKLSRAISLPENVDVEKIQAQYENGVLSLTLPKREEAKPRQIAIEVK